MKKGAARSIMIAAILLAVAVMAEAQQPKQIGLTIPSNVLARADRVLEKQRAKGKEH